MPDIETDFPRGGAPTLTPLEVRKIRADAEKDVLFSKVSFFLLRMRFFSTNDYSQGAIGRFFLNKVSDKLKLSGLVLYIKEVLKSFTGRSEFSCGARPGTIQNHQILFLKISFNREF